MQNRAHIYVGTIHVDIMTLGRAGVERASHFFKSFYLSLYGKNAKISASFYLIMNVYLSIIIT